MRWILILTIVATSIAAIIFGLLYKFSSNSIGSAMNKTTIVPEGHVKKYVLDNGMTILVRPVHTVPKVSIQLWYNVGSKDEKDNERGIAHLIEHMIFKGTKKLKESDINAIVHMLSGSCNAFTSYDYTGYLFNLPSQHWQTSFDIMADSMQNCTFKDYMLNSEMKAVIQELKLYKDRYDRSLVDEMIGSIFHDHPYHHPIIGYKQDLWSVHSDDLKRFYKKHYLPNNATLVVVGDVDPQQVYQLAQDRFGAIPANPNYRKTEFYHNKDIASKTVTLYRDVKQPLVIFSYVTPGTKSGKDNVLELLARIVGRGKGSRLYKKLVQDMQLVTSLSASADDLFDHGLFFIAVEPKNIEDIDKIQSIIIDEFADLKKNGVTDQELDRAIKKTEMSLHSLMEDLEHQAYEIGKYYLATGDENYVFNFVNMPRQELKKEINQLLHEYFRPSVLHKGSVLPLPESDKDMWAAQQERSDQLDNEILSARQRTEPIEAAEYAKTVSIKEPGKFAFPKATISQLSNNLKILAYNNPNTPKIDIILDLKAKHYFDPADKQGLGLFVSSMLMEGTTKHDANALIDAIEAKGMSVTPYPGGIAVTVLKDDLEDALSILNEILTEPLFDPQKIEKVRAQLIAKIKNFWDDPRYFSTQLVKETLYKDHPYSKNSLGKLEDIENISRDDLIAYHKQFYSPQGARVALVGDLEGLDIPAVVQKTMGNWHGPDISDIEFPQLGEIEAVEIDHYINRDQVILKFAGLSIDRKHPDYDKLLLFDQIFGGGALGSMHSRLFQLREQSGLFYTIGGSLVSGADEQPGMITVQTIVSLDRLQEAEKSILETMHHAAEKIEDQEFDEARRAIINAQIDNFVSNYGIANVLLFLDKYQFADDYFDTRAQRLSAITIDEVKEAAQKRLRNNLLTLRVGRVGKKELS